MKLQDLIKTYRKEHKLSMQEFASRSGLSKGYISMLENGKHPQNSRPLTPSIDTYQKIAIGMGIPLDELLRIVDGDELVSVGIRDSEGFKPAQEIPKDFLNVFSEPLTREQQELEEQLAKIRDALIRMPPDLRKNFVSVVTGLVPQEQSQGDHEENQ